MQPEGPQKNFASIAEQAREAGATATADSRERRNGRIGELKTIALNTITEARRKYNSAKDSVNEIRQKTTDIKDTMKGFAISPEARGALASLVKDKAEGYRDRIDSRAFDIRENAFNKAEKVLLAAQNRMNEAVQNAQNNFRSDVAEARSIAARVKQGGNEVVNYFQHQGERAVANTRANIYDSIADYRQLQALPDRAIGSILGKITSFFQERTNNSQDKLQAKLTHANNLRNTANALRLGTSPSSAS